MTSPILYEINQYIKQFYDVKSLKHLKYKLNYKLFLHFQFSCLSQNITNFVHIFSSKKKLHNHVPACMFIHFVTWIYTVSFWSQGQPLQEKISDSVPSWCTHQYCFQLTMCHVFPSSCDLCEYISDSSFIELPLIPLIRII